MSSEQLGAAQNVLKGNLGGAWDINKGYQDAYTDLGIARRFGGAAAAYSLRDIGAMNGSVVRARREPQDTDATINDEENFSANQVQSGALEDWVNGKLENTLPCDVATAASAFSLRKVKASYGIPVTEVNGTDGFPATLTGSEQSITGTSFTVRHFANSSPDSSEATAAGGVYRVSATKTSAAAFAKSIRIKGLEDGKQYTVKGEFRMVEDTTSGGDSVAQVDISDNSAGTDEDSITTASTTFVPFFIDAGYNSGGSDNFIDFTVSAIGSETGTITAEFRNVQIIENNNSAVRIRRGSDDVEVVVGFDSNGKVSSSSAITNVSEEGGESGSTSATDLNGFLNESTENFSAIAYGSIQAKFQQFSSTPTISNTAISGSTGSVDGDKARLGFALPLQLTSSEFDGCKVKVTGTINTFTSDVQLIIKPSLAADGDSTWSPPEGNKTIPSGTTGSFEYIFTGDSTNAFKSVVFIFEDNSTFDISNLKFEIIEHSAFVNTLYDQAGVNNGTQPDASEQPQIAANGSLLTVHGQTAILFDGVDDSLHNSKILSANNSASLFIVAKSESNSSGDFFFTDGSTGSTKTISAAAIVSNELQITTTASNGLEAGDSVTIRIADSSVTTNPNGTYTVLASGLSQSSAPFTFRVSKTGANETYDVSSGENQAATGPEEAFGIGIKDDDVIFRSASRDLGASSFGSVAAGVSNGLDEFIENGGLATLIGGSSTTKGFINGFEIGSASTPTNTAGNNSINSGGTIGGHGTASSLANFYLSEMIVYTSDQIDNRFKIESNINNFYNIYNDENDTNGNFVESNSNSSFTANGKLGFTATSASSSDGGGAIQLNETVASGDKVYISFMSTKDSSAGDGVALRQTTGGTIASNEQPFTVGFNSFSLTANAANADFVVFMDDSSTEFTISDFRISRIERNGFVESWYDQSGNSRTMTQSTAADQPHIVENGGMCKDPTSNPTVKFVNVGTNLGSTFLSVSSNIPTLPAGMTQFFVTSTKIDPTGKRCTFAGGASDSCIDDADLELRRCSPGGANKNPPTLEISTNTNSLLVYGTNSSLVARFDVNASSENATSAFTGTINETAFQFLGENSASASDDTFGLQGTISETMLYTTDLDTEITTVKNNLNNHYNIY